MDKPAVNDGQANAVPPAGRIGLLPRAKFQAPRPGPARARRPGRVTAGPRPACPRTARPRRPRPGLSAARCPGGASPLRRQARPARPRVRLARQEPGSGYPAGPALAGTALAGIALAGTPAASPGPPAPVSQRPARGPEPVPGGPGPKGGRPVSLAPGRPPGSGLRRPAGGPWRSRKAARRAARGYRRRHPAAVQQARTRRPGDTDIKYILPRLRQAIEEDSGIVRLSQRERAATLATRDRLLLVTRRVCRVIYLDL